jgi:quinohemoprotein amine dehydrogenase
MTRIFRAMAGLGAVCTLVAALVSGQNAPSEVGIPVTDPLVIAKCGSCHPSDDRKNMQRVSWERTTPEGWQDVLKEQILLDRLSVTPSEARTIVKYLSSSHGLAPEEAQPVMYDAERRVYEETLIPNAAVRENCSKCHAFARALAWRRSAEDWKQFAATHAERYKVKSTAEAVSFLTGAAPLHTPAWEAWSGRAAAEQNLAGRWLASAYVPGRGAYSGEMQIDRDGDGDYATRVTLVSVRDGSKITRSGRATVFGASAWRGRSKGAAPSSTPDDLSGEAREVLLIASDQKTAQGRWFWGQYQEFGFDVKLQRASSEAALLAIDRPSLKIGSRASRIRLIGDNFPVEVAAKDLDFGAGVSVSRIVSSTSGEIVAELNVAQDATSGTHDVRFRGSSLPGAFAIYDRVDYIQVMPDSSMAAFGDRAHPKGYHQFEAIGYQRGPDGKPHTDDDVALGPVDVTWTHEVFHAGERGRSEAIGSMSPLGLFTPANANPGANFDVMVIATAQDEKDQKGEPLVGKSYLVVTIPTYTFNGRQYVRELDRWVDDGPARK